MYEIKLKLLSKSIEYDRRGIVLYPKSCRSYQVVTVHEGYKLSKTVKTVFSFKPKLSSNMDRIYNIVFLVLKIRGKRDSSILLGTGKFFRKHITLQPNKKIEQT
jgi:hypothetical protein